MWDYKKVEFPVGEPNYMTIQGKTLPLYDLPSTGLFLKARREELGLTQQEVANLAEITLRQYQRFESNERSLRSSSFRIGVSVCRALHLDPEQVAL